MGRLMFQLDTLGRQVSRKVKSRGKEYFENNTVRILYADPEFVSAHVKGSREYEVDLERDDESLLYSCDCPYYDENLEVCKHVWATLLTLEAQGHLKKWNLRFPVELVPAISIDTENDLDFEDFEDRPEVEWPASNAQPAPPALPHWHRIINRMSQAQGQTPAPTVDSWPAGREILYFLAIGRRSAGDMEVSLRVEYRDPRKNGGWKKSRLLRLSHETIAHFPDPADREIVARLLGVRRETWFYSRYEPEFGFQPGTGDFESLMPIISRTDRLYLRTPEYERPIWWDESEPWQFRIAVKKIATSRQYEVAGEFHRRGEKLSATRPELVLQQGVLLMEGALAPFSGSYDWISLFRREGSFFVDESEGDAWLENMFRLPAVPEMELPEELRLAPVDVSPRPVAHVATRQEAWGAPYLVGELSFDYLGNVVGEDDPTTVIALIAQRQKIIRNPDLEDAARKQFESAGFKRHQDFSGKMIWKISQSRLPIAVRSLVTAGWQVSAEGKLFRNPDSFKLRISSGIDWFELHGSVEFGETQVAIPRLLSALKRHQKTIVLDDGTFGMLPEEWLEQYAMLANLGTTQEDHVRFSRSQVGLLDALLASRPDVSCDELFDNLRHELRSFQGIIPSDPPSGFQGTLRSYQRDGLGWLHFLQQFRFGGCLADDMGLGKTVQVLAVLEERRILRRTNGSGGSIPPSLVVMPRSLVFNWRQEADRFTPELRVLEHTGAERIRGYEHFDDYDVVFTTYGTLRRDALFFKEKTFDYVILDEAQAIKNASTESAKAARLLNGNHRLALSGTPVENHLGELWSLFEFLNPGMLGSASVFKLGRGSEPDHALLAHALRPFILRRTKSQVAPDLPDKSEQTLFCRLEAAQRELYDELRDHYRRTLLERVSREGIAKSKIQILEALLRLRQAAIHPGLIDQRRSAEPSAKMDMLMPHLAEVLDEGHKALVFSQFTSMLGILRRRLEDENIPYEYLDGQTRDRSAPVERFQNDPDCRIFLISLKAGGLGLNLTAAEYVFLLDPWWNPAVEAQAIDRTHRIGQTCSVFAYRLIAQDTVEEKVLQLQKSKRAIADAIINQDNSILSNLRAEDLAILLS